MRGFSVKLLKPVGEHLTILIVSIDKASVAGIPEQVPLTVGYILVKRGGDNRCADVARATAYKHRQSDLAKLVGILEVLQTAKRLVLIGTPAIEIGLRARTFRASDTFGGVFVDTDDKLLKIMVVGPQIGWVVPLAGGFSTTYRFLVVGRQILDEPMLFARPEAA